MKRNGLSQLTHSTEQISSTQADSSSVVPYAVFTNARRLSQPWAPFGTGIWHLNFSTPCM
jgi:hypothetical protein